MLRAATPPEATAEDAKAFLDTVNQSMLKLGIEASQGGWVQQNFITADTEALGARTNQRYIDTVAGFVKQTPRFDKLEDHRIPANEWPNFAGTANVVLVDGWCMGATPEPVEALEMPVNDLELDFDENASWRTHANTQPKKLRQLVNSSRTVLG